MKPDEFLSLADNSNFIEGIYNYCDRWCERCHMTHRCPVYAATPPDEEIRQGSAEEKKHAMFRQVENSFQLTIDLLNKLSSEQGIDLSSLPNEDTAYSDRKDIQTELKKSPLSRLAKEYLDNTHRWLDNFDSAAKAKDAELKQAQILQLAGRNPELELEELKTALDVVHWYYFQINVKLVRAQSSRLTETDLVEELDPFPKDSDGSAKVALTGIERSIGAWGVLLRHFPEQEESILSILSILQKLFRMTEIEFPGARSFFREGLDV